MLRRFLAVSAVVAALTLSGCTPSYFTTTSDPYTPAGGGWTDVDGLSLRNVVAVSDQDGSATLVGTILNGGRRADRLLSIRIPGGEAVFEPVAVPRSGHLQMGATGPGGVGPVEHIELRGDILRAGEVVPMTFEFENSAPARLDVIVVGRDGWYAEVPLPGQPLQPANPPRDDVVGN